MGKRELLLFLGFLAFGAVVYQATAPPAEPTKEGFSFSKFVGQVQAEIKGERAETQVERAVSADAPSEESGRLVIPEFRGMLTIVGEDRHDLAATLKARVYGMDDDQAKARAEEVNLSLEDRHGDLHADIALPREFRRRPQLELVLRVPEHLPVTLELRNGQADLRRVGEVKLENSRGKVSLTEIGDVAGSLENGDLEIVHANGVRLKLTRTKALFEEITGELTLDADRGELRLRQLHGEGTLTLARLDCEIENPHGSLHIEPSHVGLDVRNVSAPLTIKGDTTRVLATLDAAVPVTITTTDEMIDLRVPREGVTIDARTQDGSIRVADSGSTVETDPTGDEARHETREKQKDKNKSDKRQATEPDEDVEQPEPPAPPEPSPHPMPMPEHREMRRRGPQDLPPPPAPPAPPAPAAVPQTPGERRGGSHPDRDEHETRVQRTTIKLRGGGPLITLRNERADIVIR